jgi:diguanylate cyclase
MFSLPENATIFDVNMQFNLYTVGFSLLAAGIGAFTALSCNARVGPHSLISKNIWLFLASIAMGMGIWSMHFLGMTAFNLPVHLTHNLFLTILSFFPAFIASLFAFYFVNHPRKSKKLYIVAAILMGMGIVCMHYLGMYAMSTEPLYFYYQPVLFILSVVVAIVVSYVALYVFSNVQTYMMQLYRRIGTSIVLALAVASMHYTGMYAMRFYTLNSEATIHGVNMPVDMTSTAFIRAGVAISIFFILLVFVVTTMFDRYIEIRVSHFDPLTKLPNRRLFQLRMEKMDHVHSVAIWHFEDIEKYNQEHGYLFVDRLINHVANFLKQHTPPYTDLYRTEGNRFTFVTNDVHAALELESNLPKLAAIFREELYFEEKEISLKGVCAYVPSDGSEILRKVYLNALAILKHPSIIYKFDLVKYNPKFHTRNFTDEIIDNLNEGMEKNDLFLVYQPKINPDTKDVKSVEALIRWQHPVHGFLSPGIFLPIVEANDLMFDLTDWIIEKVCQQLVEWRDNPLMPQEVAINISGPYLTSTRLLSVIKSITRQYGINPNQIELEITETSFVKTIASAEKAVKQYRAEGFSVALDDFGTGVSSLSYLKKIPITTIKIDKSFVDDVPYSEKDNSILKSMVQLGRSLNMHVVVEGVETYEQANYLEKECFLPMMQGFYFAKPMKPQELVSWCYNYQAQNNQKVPLE